MRNFNLIISVAVAISAIVGISAASAADLPARTYTKAPAVVAPVYSWTGFYVGVNAGWHSAGDPTADVFTAPGFFQPSVVGINAAFPTSLSSSGFAGGLQAGYNWQVSSLVVGIEADFDWMTGSKSQTTATPGSAAQAALGCGVPSCWVISDTAKDRWLSTVRGRVGFLPTGNVLIYATGGVAFAGWSINHTFTDTTFGYAYAPVSVTTRTGWTVGGGVEGAISANWLLRAEYLYAGFGTVTNTVASAAGGFGPTTLVYQDKLSEQVVRVGASYKFN
jgi:outer membrane immunogenic protein